jgi:hypothetical protein
MLNIIRVRSKGSQPMALSENPRKRKLILDK